MLDEMIVDDCFFSDKELNLLDNRPLFDVETSSNCNISCAFCPREKMESIGTGIMSKELFETISNWIPSNSSVLLSGMGEPLINKDIELLIQRIRKRKIPVSMITNGLLLTKERFESLVTSGICEIQISIQSFDRERYEGYVRNSNHLKLMDNIHNLIGAERNGVKIRMNSVLPMNPSERDMFERFCKDNDFIPFIRDMHSRGGTVSQVRINRKGCGLFPTTTFITCKGDVMMCSNNRFGLPIGNILEDSYTVILEKKKKVTIQNPVTVKFL